jgi:tetratricopeptide (TPR) repeat protein
MVKYDKLKFINTPMGGEFDWGDNRAELFDRFYDAEESPDREIAESEFKMIIREDPEFIDAYNSLGWMALEESNDDEAQTYFQKAFKIGNSLIPKDFKGEIPWGIIANRPFLRALQSLGLSYLVINKLQKALDYFEKNLKYNPNDNQGIRTLAIHCYMALGECKKILHINRSFPNDTMPETMYGKVFALFNLQKNEEAEEALKEALQHLPLVAKELIAKNHEPPLNFSAWTVTFGSQDEAYDYWQRLGKYWTSPMIKKFLENGIAKFSNKNNG